jgi:hypothetical protein
VTVYNGNVMAVNNVHKWCRESESGKDEQSSGQPSTFANPVQDFDAPVQTDMFEYCSIGIKV